MNDPARSRTFSWLEPQTLAAATAYTSTDLHVGYLRAMDSATGRALAEGIAEHVGRRHGTARGTLTAEQTGKMIATATTGIAILSGP